MSPAGKDAHTTRWHASDPVGYPPLRVAHSRKVMKGEDKWFATPDARWVPPGASPDDPDVHCHFSAFGLFDGHGGKDAAEHCVETMLPCLLAALDARGPVPPGVDPEDVFEDRLPAALEDAFEASDAAFLARDIHSGATATIVIVNGRCVTTAAVGDSLATVDVGAGAPPARLTAEHRLDTSAPERDRIRAAGGEVRATAFEDGKPVGPLRVWPGGLAVSRSVGDRDGKKGGVTSKPEVSRVYVPDEQPGFRLVMASDGLWDAVTVKQAAACGAKLGTAPAAAALCKLAQKQKDNRDDITVVVVDALASVGHKDPFVAKAPWRSEIKARWPLGHRKYDTVPSPSARRAARTDAAAREAAVEAAAAAAAAEAAAEAETTPRRADARWADDAPGNAGAADDDEGWEEVPSSHSMRSSSANDTRATGGKGGRVGRGSGEKEKGRGARGGRGGRLGESKEKFGGEKGRGAGLGAGRGAGRGGRGGRGGGVDAAATARVAAGMENLRVSAAVPAGDDGVSPGEDPRASGRRDRTRASGRRAGGVGRFRNPDEIGETQAEGEERTRGRTRGEGGGGGGGGVRGSGGRVRVRAGGADPRPRLPGPGFRLPGPRLPRDSSSGPGCRDGASRPPRASPRTPPPPLARARSHARGVRGRVRRVRRSRSRRRRRAHRRAPSPTAGDSGAHRRGAARADRTRERTPRGGSRVRPDPRARTPRRTFLRTSGGARGGGFARPRNPRRPRAAPPRNARPGGSQGTFAGDGRRERPRRLRKRRAEDQGEAEGEARARAGTRAVGGGGGRRRRVFPRSRNRRRKRTRPGPSRPRSRRVPSPAATSPPASASASAGTRPPPLPARVPARTPPGAPGRGSAPGVGRRRRVGVGVVAAAHWG